MSDLLDQILEIIENMKDDELKLQQILDYLETEVIDEDDSYNPMDELPEKYRPLVNEIAQYIDMGLICYLNTETVELSTIPLEIYYEVDHYKDAEKMKQKLDEEYGWQSVEFLDWDNPIEFRPFPSNKSFLIMEEFTVSLPDDEKIRPRLIDALRNRKPFANFGRIVDNSHLREEWFRYKEQYLDNVVAEDLLMELDNLKENENEV